ncbi:hypothetical protein DFH94DRAFT_682824 [Russula ochroleuca]|uniref:Uncharacterized protein n=1 Tax=Russula ochroleuca TaxID=152965 RepID=A0A9P5T6N3_9AGAM|nr:hypothetical protein DFH94DRAFT_682824 [Russula ochroleuca]
MCLCNLFNEVPKLGKWLNFHTSRRPPAGVVITLVILAICAPTQRLVVVNLNKQNSNDLHTGVSLILLTSSPILGITGKILGLGSKDTYLVEIVSRHIYEDTVQDTATIFSYSLDPLAGTISNTK